MTNDIPPFVRFATVRMKFWTGDGYNPNKNAIEEQRKHYQALVPRIKSSVMKSTSLEFSAAIKHDDSFQHFTDFLQLVKFIDTQFLQVFHNCSCIKINTYTLSNESARTKNLYSFLDAFFQLGPIGHFSTVYLHSKESHHTRAHEFGKELKRIYNLPCKSIANWLEIIPSNDSGRQQSSEKYLSIDIHADPSELAEHLKKVWLKSKQVVINHLELPSHSFSVVKHYVGTGH